MDIKAKEIKVVPIKSVKFYSRNRNKHSAEQIERLCKLLEYQGMRVPLVVDSETNEVIAGNGRLEAMKKMKWKEVPVIFQSFESEEQRYAFSVSDNGVASWAELDFSGINLDIGDFGPDFDLDLLGIKDFKIDVSEKEALCDEDEVPEKVEPKTKLGDLYLLGEHRLLCGDSTNIQHVERLMNGQKADMVFTDPPYGVSIVKGSIKGSKSFGSVGGGKIAKVNSYAPIIGDDTINTAVDAYNLCASLNIQILIFWGGNYYASAMPNSSCWIVWDKQNTGNFADAELAWTNQKTATRIFKHTWNGMIKASEHGSKRVHPTQKPIALAEWCFKEYGEKSKLVFDLFGGSGSTLIACEKTNRKCFMMELDPHYCDVIVARWEKYTGQKALLESGTYEV